MMIRRSLFEAFNSEFEKTLSGRGVTEAFNVANENFERQHGFNAYSDYDSFRGQRRKKLKLKRPN